MLKKAFGIILPWPQADSAEKEAVARVCIAADNLGLKCHVLDSFGYDPATGKRPTGKELDFLIGGHFSLPKMNDAFTLGVTLNPVEYFLKPFNDEHIYDRLTATLLTHDDILSCSSDCIDAQTRRSLHRDRLHLPPELIWYFSCPEPVIPVTQRPRKLFYITSNWDRGRHGDFLHTLDSKDLVEIFGPKERFKDTEYRNYKGEIPFDGVSVVKRISQAGAALVISAPEHIASGMVSNRLHEGLAAGAVIICDQNPFPREHFGDCLLYIDTEAPDILGQVSAHLEWMNANPVEAAQMAEKAQQIFRDKFSLDHDLKRLYDSLEKRKEALNFGLDPDAADNPKVQLLYLLTDPSKAGMERCKASCCDQDYKATALTVLMEPDPQAEKMLARLFKGSEIEPRILPVAGFARECQTRRGHVLAEGIRAVLDEDFSYLNILTSEESPFSTHVSSLVRLMQRNPDQVAGASTEVFEMPSRQAEEMNVLHSSAARIQMSTDFSDDLNQLPIGFARFIFSKQSLQEASGRYLDLLPYLHHKAMAALTAGLELARTGLATVLTDRETPFFAQRVNHEMEDPLIEQVYPTFRGLKAEQQRQLQAGQRQLQQQQQELQVGQRELQAGQQQLQAGQQQLQQQQQEVSVGQQYLRKRMKKRFRHIKRAIALILLTWLILELLR